MDVLNESSLQSLLLACYEKPGYNGAIIFDSKDRLEEFVYGIKSNIIDDNNNPITGIAEVESVRNPFRLSITYNNGSRISIVPCEAIHNNAYFHEILLDDSVISSTIIINLQRKIRKYSARTALYREVADDAISGISENFRDTNELDEFLNSFRIIE